MYKPIDRISLGNTQLRQKEGVYVFENTWITFLLDGSEQPVQNSGNEVYDSQFYSAKKGQHSINIFLILGPNGWVLYLSPSYPGLTRGDDIVKFT